MPDTPRYQVHKCIVSVTLQRPVELPNAATGKPLSACWISRSSSVAHHASLVYAKNVANFIGLLIDNGAIAPDPEDDVVNESIVSRDGEIVNARVRDALGVAS